MSKNKKRVAGQLECQSHDLSPDDTLSEAAAAYSERFNWYPPSWMETPPPRVGQSLYDTDRGKVSYYQYLNPAEPMDIDSGLEASTNDIYMFDSSGYQEASDLPVPYANRKVHFYPRDGDARPQTSDSGPQTTRKGKPSLVERVKQLDQYASSVIDQYVPVSPHQWDSERDFTPPKTTHTSYRAPYVEDHSEFSPENHSTPLHPAVALERKKLSPRLRRSPKESCAPAVQELYPDLQNRTVSQQYRNEDNSVYEEPTRTIGGMFVGLITTIPALIGSLWSRIWRGNTRAHRAPQEIVAVETSPYSGKRRAVAAEDVERSPRAFGNTALPGYYPAPSPPSSRKIPQIAVAMATPPDSRPNSSGEDTSPKMEQATQSTQHTGQEAEKKKAVTQQKAAAPAQRRLGYFERPGRTTLDFYSSRVKQASRPAFAAPSNRLRRTRSDDVARQALKDMSMMPEYGKKRDQDVDALIEKAKKVTIESPEQKALRESVSTRKRRLQREHEEKIREEEREKAEEVARLKAIEDARIKAEEEERQRLEEERIKQAEEEARVAAEIAAQEEAKRLAEEQAANAAAAATRSLIPTLSAELEQKIAATMAITDASKIVATTTEGTEIKRYDLGRILPQPHEKQLKNMPKGGAGGPGEWLNDEAVNGFISAIVSRKLDQVGYVKRADTIPAYVAYNTSWYPTVKRSGIKGINRWSRRKHIAGEKLLECEQIYFPVSTGAHWTITIISPKARTIEVLDSAGGKRSGWFQMARDWLKMELNDAYIESEWVNGDARSQSQTNTDDCGVFTCMNALASATEGKGFEHVTMTSARKFIVAVLVNGGFPEDMEL